MSTTIYSGPQITADRTGICPTCGRPAKRRRTFSGTVNPYNTTPDPEAPGGKRPKTWAEVYADVQADAEAWAPAPEVFEHDRCRTAAATAALQPAPPVHRTEQGARRVQQVTEAAARAALTISTHGLYAGHLEVKGTHSVAGEAERMAEVEVQLFGGGVNAGEFMRWLGALPYRQVQVDTRADTVYLRATCEYMGVVWRVHTSVYRRGAAELLPGAEVVWNTDHTGRRSKVGYLGVDDTVAVLRRLGIPEVLA